MWISAGAEALFDVLVVLAALFVFFGALGLFLARLKPEEKEPPHDEA